MENGFYTALGTPLDTMGNLRVSSFQKQVQDQVQAGASGLLVMGSMGIQAYIKHDVYVNVARSAVEAAKAACPVFVGVMDQSIQRVLDRIESLAGLAIDGVVATTPFYGTLTQKELIRFFSKIAERSPFPLYLYDLANVTKTKIQTDSVIELMSVNNINGIKTGDLTAARVLSRLQPEINPNFDIFFSGLDVFDAASACGLTKQLDGMFSCTAPIAGKMYAAFSRGEYQIAASCLDEILLLRNILLEAGIWEGYTYAMNLLGYEGNFAPDYVSAIDKSAQEKVKHCMKNLHLI